MNQFIYLLKYSDYEEIKLDYKKKWGLIRERVEEQFQDCQNSPRYKPFIELIIKSELIINAGDKEAPNITLELYKKNILEITKKHELSLANSNKI